MLAVVYLVFNEGYLATVAARRRCAPTSPPRRSGSARVLRELMPDDPEVAGLLALMLLIEARRTAGSPAASW